MAQYYYAVAALPGISFDSEPQWTIDGFLDFAREQLTPNDYQTLCGASLEPVEVAVELEPLRNETDDPHDSSREGEISDAIAGSGAASHWRSFETDLRNALTRVRTDDPNRQNAYFRTSGNSEDSSVHDVAREAYAAATPLDAEYVLDKARYAFLEELEVGHFFDIDRLVVYYLKLQLVTRRTLQTVENGRSVFEKRYNSVVEQMGAIQNL